VKEVLIVDDVATNRELIREALASPEYEFHEAANANDALEAMRNHPADLVITDVRMPGASGVELLKELQREYPNTIVILVTAFGTVESAVEAMKAGARDYVTRPLDLDKLGLVVRRALGNPDLLKAVSILRPVLDKKRGFEDMLGRSHALLQTLDQARRAAATSSTVLIQGETGTGKELLARGIHANSRRSAKPFITLNCSAIPKELLESELFGHLKGSFTSAVLDRKGRAEAAHGGTLFLDEIGEMPLELQAKVLRLIQHGEIEKVGAASSTRVDIRVVAATHRNLAAMVENGAFREDLYYRLNVIPLSLPSLRERREDIPELARFFFERSCSKQERKDLRLPDRLLDSFVAYRWPGNIRELENIVERIVVLTSGNEVTSGDLPAFLQTEPTPLAAIGFDLPPSGISLGDLERELLLRALQECNWNQSRAARYLSLSRRTLIYRMQKYNLIGRPPSYIVHNRSKIVEIA